MSEFDAAMPPDAPREPFDRLCWIMDRLLGEGGCPWDREQTHETLRQYLIEESYEVHDAIERGDDVDLCEELGDVLLQVVFHARLAAGDDRFDIENVIDTVCEKLVRRHPHVFGQTVADTAGQVLENWEKIKQREKSDAGAEKRRESILDGVPLQLPALQKAHRMQEKAARVGFDWPSVDGAIDKLREEIDELEAEIAQGDEAAAQRFEEFGDLLFSLVNVARFLDIQPEEALQASCAKFARRFAHVERRAAEQGRTLDDMTLEEMDALWNEVRRQDKEEADA